MSGTLILASSSRYRRELLSRLRLPFEAHSPDIDESPHPNEQPHKLVMRLARSKAAEIARRRPGAWVIGSDQVAVCRDKILGKPGTADRCFQQLKDASGQSVSFLTAVCLMHSDGTEHTHLDTTVVEFRELSDAEIQKYIEQEQPFDCAGGFKVEGLGITLFERIDNSDPTALIGLPLIWLSEALRRAGIL